VFNVNIKGEEIVHRQLLVICDFYWFSTLRIKINAENNNFKDKGSDIVAAVKPTLNINPSLFAVSNFATAAA
jgi:hypothetical protein